MNGGVSEIPLRMFRSNRNIGVFETAAKSIESKLMLENINLSYSLLNNIVGLVV